jgi:hypothetical protein
MIHKIDNRSPLCPMVHCGEEETTQHFLLDCPAYVRVRTTSLFALMTACTCPSEDEYPNCAAFFGDLDFDGQVPRPGPLHARRARRWSHPRGGDRRRQVVPTSTWTSPRRSATRNSRMGLRSPLLLVSQYHAAAHSKVTLSSAALHNTFLSAKQLTHLTKEK